MLANATPRLGAAGAEVEKAQAPPPPPGAARRCSRRPVPLHARAREPREEEPRSCMASRRGAAILTLSTRLMPGARPSPRLGQRRRYRNSPGTEADASQSPESLALCAIFARRIPDAAKSRCGGRGQVICESRTGPASSPGVAWWTPLVSVSSDLLRGPWPSQS